MDDQLIRKNSTHQRQAFFVYKSLQKADLPMEMGCRRWEPTISSGLPVSTPLFHDFGKSRIPFKILDKPSRCLDSRERQII